MSADDRRWRAWLAGIVVLAVLVRVPTLFAPSLWYDDAVEGWMSLDVLRGRFPIFFYGQAAHGAADRYLAAPVLLALGPTALALKLAALGLYFTLLGSIAWTTRRVFGTDVAVVTALLVAFPPYYLFAWGYDARGHYPLMMILGTWAIYLTWRVVRDGVAASPRRRFVGLGLLAGAAWWINYLSLVFLLPIAVTLVAAGLGGLRGGWRQVLARGAITVGAALPGVTPILGYYLPHGLPLVPPGSVVEAEDVASYLESLTTRALPQILGIHPAIWGGAGDLGYALVSLLTGGALLYAAGWWLARWRAGDADRGTVGLLLGLVAVTLVLALTTQYGAILRYPRYLLPLYLALPVFTALAAAAIGRWWPALKWTAVGVVVGSNLLGALATTPVLASVDRGWTAAMANQIDFLERHRIERVYGGSNIWAYLSGGRVLAADPYQERVIEVARAVDGADRIGWLFRAPSAAFEQSLAAAGIGYRRLDGPGFVAYAGFALAETAYVDLDPAGWSASATGGVDEPVRAHDRQLATIWRARNRPEQPDGAPSYTLDLGRRVRIGQVTWLPGSYRDTPAGLRLAVSTDGRHWYEVRRVDEYFGPLYWSGTHPLQRIRRSRVELRFPVIEARHVRLTFRIEGRRQVSIRELLVATPAGTCPRAFDPAALVRFLAAAGVRVAYGDHWISANIARLSDGAIRVLPANKSANSYRLERPHTDEIERLQLREGRAIVLEACPGAAAEAAAATLEAGGVRFRRHAVGGFVVFAELDSELPTLAAPARVAAPDPHVLMVELATPAAVTHVVLSCRTPLAVPDAPDGLAVEVAGPGGALAPAAVRLSGRGPMYLSGRWLFRDPPATAVLELAAPRTASLRLIRRAGTWEGCPTDGVRLGAAE